MILQQIFRAYDIRGIVDEELTPELVQIIAKAIAKTCQQRQIIVARDGRLSGPELSQALIQGLLESGMDVIDIGAVPTPFLYFACFELAIENGIMLTGSHNPQQYNGLKMVVNNRTLSGDDIQALYRACLQNEFVDGQGKLAQTDIIEKYQQRIVSDIRLARGLKIVVDAGNGIVGKVAPQIYRALGCEVIELFCDVDGRFPNHHPDPSVAANLQDLIAAVKHHQADVGLAFDGDGDRLGVVTPSGEVINPDRQLIIFSQAVLAKNPGAKIIYDVKCSLNLKQAIHDAGGLPIMTKTGHSFVKAELKAQQALLAGEMSGHIFFADRWYGFDDGIYAGARLLEILSAGTLNWAQIPDSVNTPEIKIPIAEADKFQFVEDFVAQAHFDNATKLTIDGLRVEFADGWGLLRASNTTPCLVMRFEADNTLALARIQADFMTQIRKLNPKLEIEV